MNMQKCYFATFSECNGVSNSVENIRESSFDVKVKKTSIIIFAHMHLISLINRNGNTKWDVFMVLTPLSVFLYTPNPDVISIRCIIFDLSEQHIACLR